MNGEKEHPKEDRDHSTSHVHQSKTPKIVDSRLYSIDIVSTAWKDSVQSALTTLSELVTQTRQASSNTLEINRKNSTLSFSSKEEKIRLSSESGCWVMPPFSPYEAKVPWHTGSRAILSLIFPKYGKYCGPNWSSGRNRGSLVWDEAPVDWLDFCCFKHDVGYDSHSQEELHKADCEFLSCLLRMPRERGNLKGFVREAYRTTCIFGLTRFLIPYRRMLLRQQQQQKAK